MKRLQTLLVGCAFACIPIAAFATVVVPADLGELSRDAMMIVRGRIVSLDARWTDDRRRVETLVTLEVENYLKGAFGPIVQFRVPGGRLGRYRSVLVGAPEFLLGQRVVVFLAARGPALPYLLGLGQGVFRVAAAAGGPIVTPPVIVPGSPASIVRGDPTRHSLPLAEFERLVRDMARTTR